MIANWLMIEKYFLLTREKQMKIEELRTKAVGMMLGLT